METVVVAVTAAEGSASSSSSSQQQAEKKTERKKRAYASLHSVSAAEARQLLANALADTKTAEEMPDGTERKDKLSNVKFLSNLALSFSHYQRLQADAKLSKMKAKAAAERQNKGAASSSAAAAAAAAAAAIEGGKKRKHKKKDKNAPKQHTLGRCVSLFKAVEKNSRASRESKAKSIRRNLAIWDMLVARDSLSPSEAQLAAHQHASEVLGELEKQQ